MTIRHGAYYLRDKGKHIWLCRVSAGESELYRALSHLTKPEARTVSAMVESFLTHGTADLRPATIKSYTAKKKPILAVFGDMPPAEVTSGHVAQYLELRRQQGHSVAGNREIEVLSSAYNYGQRNGMCDTNPCRGVRRNRERPRRRYIRDDEFRSAFERASEPFQDLLAVALLTGLRQRDLRFLRRDQVGKGVILLEESKTGKRLEIALTESLRFFLDRAMTRCESEWVLTNSKGQQWREWAIQSAMRRLDVDWTFHDLRAKAESDHAEGLGLMALYKRAKKISPVR